MGIKERKEREKEARREEILNAAEKIFFERGLTVATMDEIAEGAELSKGTLYLYYKSKEDLYLAVALRGMEIMYGLFQEATTTPESPIKHLFNLGEAYFSYFENYRRYYRMLYFLENPQVHSQVSPEMHEVCSTQDRRIWDLVIGVVRRAIDQGLIRSELDPLEVGVMLWSNSNGLMRLIDRGSEGWHHAMGLDLEAMLRKSNMFLVQSMLTDQAKGRMSELMAAPALPAVQ